MSKFLHKYKQWILVIGLGLLMVAWLFPQAMQQFGKAGPSATFARFDGGTFTARDFQTAEQELRALNDVSFMIPATLGLSDRRGFVSRAQEHWLLLVHEASAAGLVGGKGDGRALLDKLAIQVSQPQFGGSGDPKNAKDMLEKSRARAAATFTPDVVDTALAKAVGVSRLLASTRSLGTLVSAKEAEYFGWQRLDTALADVVLVPASAVAGELTAPDEARIQAHFEKYKATNPDLDPMSIGYLRPSAVQVEWISISRQAVIESMTADAVEVNKFWRQNKASFGGGDDFAAVRKDVETEFKRQAGEKVLEKARDAINRTVLRSMSGIETSGQYRVLPADWASKMPAMGQLAAAARGALGLENAAGMVIVTPADGVFRSRMDLNGLPGIGTASGRVGEVPSLQFAQAAADVKELGVDNISGTQVGVVYGPLKDSLGQNEYYFRVTAARREGAPESSADLVDRIKSDIALLDGFDLVKSRIDTYKAQFAEKGAAGMLSIPGVRMSADKLLITRDMVTSSNPSVPMSPAEADTESLRDAVMNVASAWDPKADVAAIPAVDRTVGVADVAARGVLLAQITGRRPLNLEMLAENEGLVVNSAMSEVMRAAMNENPLSFENLSKRLNYRIDGRDPEEEKKAEATAAADAAKKAGA